MNPDENKQLILDFIKIVWVNQDVNALPDFWTADCINHAMPEGADNRGLAALRAYHEQFGAAFSAFSDMRIEILQQVAETDRVVTQLLTRAQHTGPFLGIAPTGKNALLRTIRIDRLRSGKIAEHWSVADMAGLMQQLQ
jgi:predicted ester cyclase